VTWTDEQEDIFSCRDENIVIRALAGTGKTSTLREYARRRPREPILYVVYNREARNEAHGTFPRNVEVRTSHSLAYGMLDQALRGKVGDAYPNEVAWELRCSNDRAEQALRIVRRYFATDAARVEEAARPGDSELVIGLAESLWRKMCDPSNGVIKLPHDGYLKMFAMSERSRRLTKWRTLLLDEGQDSNPALMRIVERQTHMRRILVGDENQSIYSFRGAVDAMQSFPGVRKTLTRSFRFGPSVARAANAVLAQKGETLEVVGCGGPSKVLFGERPDDALLLTFTNAEALEAAVERKQEEVWFAGGIKAYRTDRILDGYRLFANKAGEVRDREMKRCRSLGHLEGYAREINSVDLLAICGFVRRYGDEIPRMLDDLAKRAVDSQEEASFCISTAHKAKGLEFPKVALGTIFDWEDYVAQREKRFTREMVEQLNLLYVAATRAINELYADVTLAHAIAEYEGLSVEQLTGGLMCAAA